VAKLGLESKPGARSGTSPTGESRLAAREKKGRRELGAEWAVGPGKGFHYLREAFYKSPVISCES
jgi:hypothetical protein